MSSSDRTRVAGGRGRWRPKARACRTSMMRWIVALGMAGIVACAGVYRPVYRYSEIFIVNASTSTIASVRAQIGESGKILACELIGPKSICHDRFRRMPYAYEAIALSWTDGSGTEHSVALEPAIHSNLLQGFSMQVIIEIGSGGAASARLRQEEPFRDDD